MKIQTRKIKGFTDSQYQVGSNGSGHIIVPRTVIDRDNPPETIEVDHNGDKKQHKVRRCEYVRHGHMMSSRKDRLKGNHVRVFFEALMEQGSKEQGARTKGSKSEKDAKNQQGKDHQGTDTHQ